jgi:DNA topoisomerase-6 subunit B
VLVELTELEATPTGQASRFLVRIEDNGPGIPRTEIGKIFAKLLYGSKFHRLKQSRGQQGIGISAAVMYGQMTTGEPATIVSKQLGGKAHKLRLFIDTAKNAPRIDSDMVETDEHWKNKASGTSIEILLLGQYKAGRHGVEAYLKQTGLANPHARVVFKFNKAATKSQPASTDVQDSPRVINVMPREPIEIKPHPHGVELGTLQRMMEDAGKVAVTSFLTNSFSRVPAATANEIVVNAGFKPSTVAGSMSRGEVEALYKTLQATKLMAPPTSCLSPIGEEALIKGLYALFGDANNLQDDDDLEHLSPEKAEGKKSLLSAEQRAQAEAGNLSVVAAASTSTTKGTKGTKSKAKSAATAAATTGTSTAAGASLPPTTVVPTSIERIQLVKDEDGGDVLVQGENVFVTAVTRPPAIYRGNPFQVECGILYSKSLRSDELAKVFRFANRVPLLYQASACAMTKSVVSAPWRSYEVQQSKGALPTGPLVVLVHIASAWVPYTSESKEAIAHYPEVLKEMRLCVMEAGRRLQRFLRRRRRELDEVKKRDYITKYLDTIGEALQEILGLSKGEREQTTSSLKIVLEQSRNVAVNDAERPRKQLPGSTSTAAPQKQTPPASSTPTKKAPRVETVLEASATSAPPSSTKADNGRAPIAVKKAPAPTKEAPLKAPTKKAPTKKAPTKKPPTKKPPTKKPPTKKPPTKKPPTKKPPTKKPPTKKPPTKKEPTKKTRRAGR